MRLASSFARSISCTVLAVAIASCGSSSTEGSKGPPVLANTIVFVSDRTGVPELHVMHGNGDVIQLISTLSGAKTDPVISPDGRKIVFTAGDIDAVGTADIAGEFDLESRHFRTQNITPAFQYPRDGGIDGRTLDKIGGCGIGLRDETRLRHGALKHIRRNDGGNSRANGPIHRRAILAARCGE